MDSRRPPVKRGETGGEGAAKSRFAYHKREDDDPLEGGVYSVDSETSAEPRERPGTPRAAGRSGVPGPEERLLDIGEIVRTVGMRYRHVFRIPPFKEGDMDAATPVEGAITITNAGDVLLVRGKAAAQLRMECSRCLTPTLQPVEAELEEEFDLVTSHDAYQQDVVRAVDADAPASVISGSVMDLADLLRQNLLLSAPFQPLCREDCPGIDLSGREDATFIPDGGAAPAAASTPPDAEEELPDNALRHLAEMLEAKRRSEEKDAS